MAREIIVAWVGRHRREPWKALCAEYLTRTSRFVPSRELFVRSKGIGPEQRRLGEEGEQLLAALPKGAAIVALDPRGLTMTSEEFSRRFAAMREHAGTVAFVIGSDLGLDRRVVESSELSWSLGPMVFSHEIARLVVCEQIYRALAIEKGIEYHRAPSRRSPGRPGR